MTTLTTLKESSTRQRIDITLRNLGWNTNEKSPKCNVFTERAKTKSQDKALKGRPDYLLYETDTDNPIGVIEAKKPGGDLQKALKQGAGYAKSLGVSVVFATDGSIVETFDRRNGNPLRLDDELVTDFISEASLIKFVKTGSDVHTPEKIFHTKRELIKIFGEANNFLRREGLREGIERFTEFSTLLFLKLISEIESERESQGESRLLSKQYCWESFCNKDAGEMFDYINDTILPKLVGKYNHSGDVFESKLLIKNPPTLKKIVDKLSTLQLINTDSDIKGDAFEYFLKQSVTVGNDLGEYFTPRHIVKVVVELVDPKFGDKIYDPCCGTGGFLIQAFRHIKAKCKQSKNNLRILKQETVYGRELTATAKIAKMNMIIIGDGHTNIEQTDSLANPVSEKYNIVLTNYPFSQETDYGPMYGYDTENANAVFLHHVIDALKPGGRAGVVVPEGLLFGENSDYVRVRKYLVDKCNLIAIIKLHNFVFRPYTGQPTSILIFEKAGQTKDVWFFDVKEDGYKKTQAKTGRPPIKENDLLLLRQTWVDRKDSENSFSVDAERICGNKYKLSLDNYSHPEEGGVNYIKLGEVCDIKIGGTPKRKVRKYFDGGDNLWVKIGDMTSMYIKDTEEKITASGVRESNVKLIPEGALLFSFKLSVGKVAITGTDLYTNEAIAAIIPKDNRILTKYLFYLLPRLDLTRYAQAASKGSTLNSAILRGIDIPLPTLKEQKKFIRDMERQESQKERHRRGIEALSEGQDILAAELIMRHRTVGRKMGKSKKYSEAVSLHPLKPEEALKAFMQVDPEKMMKKAAPRRRKRKK